MYPETSNADNESSRGRERAAPQCRVLLVEDDLGIREMTGYFLEQNGLDVVTAGDGAEAFERLSETPLGVVVLDLFLPVMSGLDFLKALRASDDADLAKLPVVVVSAAVGPVEREARELADAFLAKPFRVTSLLAIVERLCGRRSPASEG